MQIIKAESPEHFARWDAFVRATPGAVHYHLSGWRRVIEATYRNRTVYLMAVDAQGAVSGVLPLALVRGFPFPTHLVSLPYLSYAGICARNADAASALTLEAQRWGDRLGARYLELHNLVEWGSETVRLATSHDKLRMVLDLPSDPDRLWKSLDPKVRNQTRKATKAGLEVTTGAAEFLDDFYAVFAQNMRDLGSPVHHADLLRNLLREFPDDIRIVMVRKGPRAAGGAVVVRFGDLVEVPWASSLREFLRDCPNNLLYWEILRQCCEQGARAFDFGRSTRDSGTFRFKEQWGAKPVPLYWQYALPQDATPPDPTHTGRAARLLVRIWQTLPLGVANALGPVIRGRISA